ncbi:unnamed protein product [Caenorhabditis sp. 36 PRJEB53466]|nr:unnamed protein product [Caenorhabditis sp. 36 PRJEB53466]
MSNGDLVVHEAIHDDDDVEMTSGMEAAMQIDMNGFPVDERVRRMIIDLQRHWLTDYHNTREKALVELAEKLHQEFIDDQDKIKEELLQQFKEELEATKLATEAKHQEDLELEKQKLIEKHSKELALSKKKQWCWSCDNEAIYHCCWNTSYCSVDCQQGHWQSHRKFCRRKKGMMAIAQAVNGPPAVLPNQ